MSKEYSPKEKAIYEAVIELLEEGADLNNLTVAEITGKAGIGKGTAYEYFSNKEEMIAKALFYNSESFCRQLYKGVCKEKNLHDKVDYMMRKIEQEVPKAKCLLRLMNMLSDNTEISRRLQELFKEVFCAKEGIVEFVRNILEDEFRDGKTPSKDEMEYLVLDIYSKIICWVMVLNESKYEDITRRNSMRALILDGICREVRTI